MPNAKCRVALPPLPGRSSFVIRHYFVMMVSSLIIRLLSLAIRAYQLAISPALNLLFGANTGCRFTPSCSHYARQALLEHGVLTGGALAAKRICRCHPWGGCGHDPVTNAEGEPQQKYEPVRGCGPAGSFVN